MNVDDYLECICDVKVYENILMVNKIKLIQKEIDKYLVYFKNKKILINTKK